MDIHLSLIDWTAALVKLEHNMRITHGVMREWGKVQNLVLALPEAVDMW